MPTVATVVVAQVAAARLLARLEGMVRCHWLAQGLVDALATQRLVERTCGCDRKVGTCALPWVGRPWRRKTVAATRLLRLVLVADA